MADAFSCADCVVKECLIKSVLINGKEKPNPKYGKPCDGVEKLMGWENIKSRDWIRPRMSNKLTGKKEWREIPFSSLKNFDNWGMEDKKGDTE